MATNTGNFSDMITPVHSDILYEEYMRRPKLFNRILNEQNSTRAFESDSQLIGFQAAPEKPEGTSIIFQNPKQGFTTTYNHVAYGTGYRITEEMQADDLTGKMRRLPAGLGVAMHNTVETVGHGLINNAFSAVTGGDGSPLLSGTHASAAAGPAQSNVLATPADLTATSLKDALVLFEDTNDDQGLPLLLKATTLLIPSQLRYTAQELLRSKQKPGTDLNDFNPLSEVDLGWMLSQYLTDPDAWYLIGDTHFMKFIWRQKPKFAGAHDFDTGDAKFKLTARFSVGHSDWRGIFGTPGA